MHHSKYIIYNSDSYELELDTEGNLLHVWRYLHNEPSSPRYVQLANCDEQLRDLIESRVIQLHGQH